jgi:hypothetical protein
VSAIHLFPGPSLVLIPVGFLLVSYTMSKSLYSSCNYWFFLIFHIFCSTTGSCIFLLHMFLSHVFIVLISISVIGHF